PEGNKPEHTYTWTLNDRFLQLDRKGGENHGITLIGVDPATDTVTFWVFNERGGTGKAVLTGKKGNWDFEGEWAGPKGRSIATCKLTRVDDNTLKANVLTYVKDGEAQEPREQVWTRQEKGTLAGETKAPQLCDELKEIEWWAGDFIVEGKSPLGEVVVGQTSCQPVLGGGFMCYRAASINSDLEVRAYRSITGVDPATGKMTGREFDSDGYVGAFVVSEKGAKFKGSGTYADGKSLEYEGTLAQGEGGTIDYSSKARMSTGEEVDYHAHWRPRPDGK
nr:hypothetical protein [Planctomycetota bacterium]